MALFPWKHRGLGRGGPDSQAHLSQQDDSLSHLTVLEDSYWTVSPLGHCPPNLYGCPGLARSPESGVYGSGGLGRLQEQRNRRARPSLTSQSCRREGGKQTCLHPTHTLQPALCSEASQYGVQLRSLWRRSPRLHDVSTWAVRLRVISWSEAHREDKQRSRKPKGGEESRPGS